MKAIVLAAGFATRLHPLTRDRAKPLLDVGGRPVLSWLLDRILALSEIDEVLVVTNDLFHHQFAAWRDGYDARVPVQLLNDGARSDADKRGAVGDLALAFDALADRRADLLVVAGDNLVEFDLAPHARRFSELRRPLLLVREIEGPVPPRRYGEVTVDADGNITGFREKPEQPRSELAATCLYFLPAGTLELLAEYLAGGGHHDAPGYFFEWLLGRERVIASRLTGAFYDIGNLESLERARKAFVGRDQER